jgi:uridine phosphorylase
MTLPDLSESAPLLATKPYSEPSVFTAAKLLREARRQRGLPERVVPEICVLDPDGDLTRYLNESGRGESDPDWACYHTTLTRFNLAEQALGIVPFVVGAPFAVLVAEELAASGCRLVINLTSAGRIAAPTGVAVFLVIERAMRDEGTSLHYLPASRWSHLRADILEALVGLDVEGVPDLLHGSSWTTDAPFRETATQVREHAAAGVLAVEMEAAALYAFAEATGHAVLCIAHLTNELGAEGDFEKGEFDGAEEALRVIEAVVRRLRRDVIMDEPPGNGAGKVVKAALGERRMGEREPARIQSSPGG